MNPKLPLFIFGILVATAALSTGRASEPTPPKVGEKSPDFTLKSLAGIDVQLSKQVRKGPVVLVVLRGFPGYQCPLCTLQVGELIGKSEMFTSKQASVLLIYPGPAADLQKRAREFVAGKNLPKNFELLLDPDYSFVNRYGLRWDQPNETAYPSAFVIGKDGRIAFAKVSLSHGGRARVSELLAALPQ